jgi:CRP-like cAMP-binding protein
MLEAVMTIDPPNNAVLAALPPEIQPKLREKHLVRGTAVFRPDASSSEVYFPVSGIVSVVALMDNSMVEMATIGREGMLEPAAVLGSKTSLWHSYVQVPGSALVLSTEDLDRLREQFPAVQMVLRNYLEAFLLHVSQLVACNAVHSAHQRAARWLLTCDDRHDGPFTITQELLAEMLGVSRPVVTTIAREFQRKGLIDYYRARITVSNRDGLRDESCHCYEVLRTAYRARGFWFRPG